MKYTLKNKEIELTEEEIKEIIKQNYQPAEKIRAGLEIKSRYAGETIFKSTKTTWKEAVEEAVKNGVNLKNANFRDADLSNTDLRNANLKNANFNNANLMDADFSNANLMDADFWNANLNNANFKNANLSNADFNNAKFYGKGGTRKLTKEQVPVFLRALGFIIED